MMAGDKIDATPFFESVAVRFFTSEGDEISIKLPPSEAIALSLQLAKAAKAAGWTKPKKGDGDA